MHPVLAALKQAIVEHSASLVERTKIEQVFERAQALLDAPAAMQRFDEFWKLYPNKVSKDSARRAWYRMQGDEHADEIIKNVQLRLRLNEWNPHDLDRRRFIPHAATFLNQRRWLDNPVAPQRNVDRGFVGANW